MEVQEFDHHLCYQRKPVTQAKKNHKRNFFYDFETTQIKMISCDEGYQATGQPCEKCTADYSRCNKCRICSNCRQSWCGLEEHKVNYAVLNPPASNAWRNRWHRIPNARFVVVVALDVGSWKRMQWSQLAITDVDTDRGYSEVETLLYNSVIT